MAWDEANTAGEHEASYREHDPVLRLAREMLASATSSRTSSAGWTSGCESGRGGRAQFALDSPRPTPESALGNVFA